MKRNRPPPRGKKRTAKQSTSRSGRVDPDDDDTSEFFRAGIEEATRRWDEEERKSDLQDAKLERRASRERVKEERRRASAKSRAVPPAGQEDRGRAHSRPPVDITKRMTKNSPRSAERFLRATAAPTTRRSTPPGSPAAREATTPGKRRRSSGCTEEEAAVWVALIEKADGRYQWRDGVAADKGWIHWDQFFEVHPDRKSQRQVIRELHLAWKKFGAGLFKKALLELGPSKTARLRRFRERRDGELERMLEQGVTLRAGAPPRRLAELPLKQFLAMIKMASGERDPADGGGEFRWPESLIAHTRALVLDWDAINDVTENIREYRARQPDADVQREHMDLLREVKKVLDQASAKIRRWLGGRKGARQ
jgi:hypothetical protein